MAGIARRRKDRPEPTSQVVSDPYKAHLITSGAYGLGGAREVHDPPLLFNLTDDPGVRHDIAAQHPDVVADLVKEAEAHRASMTPGQPLFDRQAPAAQR